MNDNGVYLIQLRGQVNADEINAKSPLLVKVAQADTTTTLLTVCADQAGLIGLLRHLHARGLAILSVCREP